MVKTREFLLFISLLILGLFFIYLYDYIKDAKNDIFTRIQTNKINQLSYLFKNIEEDIIQNNNVTDTASLVNLFSDLKTREKYEKNLSLFITPSMKYMYLLSKDNKGRFRFLLDASKTDKAHFYQKFDVDNPKYLELYETSSQQVIEQEDVENLYLTYLYPIKKAGKVIGVLSVDITTQIKNILLELIKPLETFFIVLIIFIFLLMLMTIVQVSHYLLTRKKIFTDSLTNLFNRTYLKEILPTLKIEHYSVALLDLDKFKNINDTYGHKVGDYILQQSAKVLKESIRDTDILIRYGGEEFLLFIYNRDSFDPSSTLCNRIVNNLSMFKFACDGHNIKMQVSIGLHENPSTEKNIHEAIKVADRMLYIAKKEGRNRVVNYSEQHNQKTIVKGKNINFVKQAIDDNRVVCYYQPIYNQVTKQIIKYEALVRIIDTNGEVLKPVFFLDEIKDTNIHYKLTQRILSIVFEEFKNNYQSVSININFSDLINNDIENSIKKAFKHNLGLAQRVTFEILESDEINNTKLFKEKIALLRSLGAKISIDDFGSGYSNFKTILDIEANYLKIDGSLIKNIDKSEKDYQVVQSIIHFAKISNMKTIAEFVHSLEVYEKLITLDIDYMQGYYIGKPEPMLVNIHDLFLDAK